MKVNNLPKVATKNDFPRLRVEPGSLDSESDIIRGRVKTMFYKTSKKLGIL
jgi:hypothetical protein